MARKNKKKDIVVIGEKDKYEPLSRAVYYKKMKKVKKTTAGRLIVKEYPPASANVNHFKNLLNELKLKRKFGPRESCC